MRATTKAAILLIFPLMVIGLVACGTEADAVTNGAVDTSNSSNTVAVVDQVDPQVSDVVDQSEDAGLVAHNEDPHDEVISEDHEKETTEVSGHGHSAANEVDPDAPVIHIIGAEFGYETVTTEVEAGAPFTIMFHNEGNLEHDITFKGMESMGGIHLQPGEDGKATYTLTEAGEYSYYCTVPGHFEAGMVSTLTVLPSTDSNSG